MVLFFWAIDRQQQDVSQVRLMVLRAIEVDGPRKQTGKCMWWCHTSVMHVTTENRSQGCHFGQQPHISIWWIPPFLWGDQAARYSSPFLCFHPTTSLPEKLGWAWPPQCHFPPSPLWLWGDLNSRLPNPSQPLMFSIWQPWGTESLL